MARPTTRDEFKEWCLRSLGKPVLDINVSAEQVDDRVDEALDFFLDYHYDGIERVIYRHQFTEEEINRARDELEGRSDPGPTQKYIQFPSDYQIEGIVKVFPINGSYTSAGNLFNLRYQLFLQDLYSFNSTNFTPWVMVKRHLENIEEIFIGDEQFRFNRKTQRLHLDNDWDFVLPGSFCVIDCYVRTPESIDAVWDDLFLKEFATQMIKRQWGMNLSKFAGVALPGGVTLDGPRILNEAESRITEMKQTLINDFSEPLEWDMN